LALTPEERKKISAQLLSTPAILNAADAAIAENIDEIAAIQETDNLVNKPAFDGKNILADAYMREARFLDGIQRQEITEADIQNGAKLTAGNFFFPNQPTINIPSLAVCRTESESAVGGFGISALSSPIIVFHSATKAKISSLACCMIGSSATSLSSSTGGAGGFGGVEITLQDWPVILIISVWPSTIRY